MSAICAWGGQEQTRTTLDLDVTADYVTGEQASRGIDHVHHECVSVEVRLAHVHWRSEGLMPERAAAEGIECAGKLKMPAEGK
ncbi:hypothetical protein ACXR0O_18810 [Verrucomicrobiota bacterium sgz303538]